MGRFLAIAMLTKVDNICDFLHTTLYDESLRNQIYSKSNVPDPREANYFRTVLAADPI